MEAFVTDLNYLYQRHQTSVFRAAVATCVSARFAHTQLSEAYAKKIRTLGAPLQPTGHTPLAMTEIPS